MFYSTKTVFLGSAIVAILSLWGGQGVLANTPGLYQVVGVAAGDVLNIREEPGAEFEDIGDLAHDGQVEVTDFTKDGRWARVIVYEGDGWVAAQFLDQVSGPFNIPDDLYCNGNEPFWSFEMSDGHLVIQSLDEWIAKVKVRAITAPIGRQAYAYVIDAERYTGVIERRECSDGMSGRTYGLSVFLLEQTDRSRILRDGCCRLLGP